MKDYLEYLFQQSNDDKIIFCHGKKTNLAKHLGEIKQVIFSLAYFLNQQKATSIILYCDNIYHFYIGFFSTLIINKSIILPPNNTCGVFKDINNNEDIATLNFDEQRQCFCFNGKSIELTGNDNFTYKINDSLFTADIIFFTSGSTGKPKKITKKFKHLINEVNILNNFFKLDKEQMVISSVHHQHLYGFIFYFLWPSLIGRPIYSQRIELSEELAQLIDINHQFIFTSSPALLSRLTFEKDLSKITCFSAGSLLKNEIALNLTNYLKLTVNEILGSSETGIIAWRKQLNNTLWQCFDDVQIIQSKDQTLRVYAGSFSEPFIDTDDVIKLIKPNQFILQGRKGRIVKLEDKRLSLTELESKLKRHPWVDDCYALKLEKSREYIGVFVVLSISGRQQKAHLSVFEFNNTLRHFLSHWFEKILLPKSFRYGSEIPINTQSKIDRGAILQLFTP